MLKVGSEGDPVIEVQRSLLRRGYNPGPIDGVFGPETEEAVRGFQERKGLVVDGIVGPATLEALEIGGEEPGPSESDRGII